MVNNLDIIKSYKWVVEVRVSVKAVVSQLEESLQPWMRGPKNLEEEKNGEENPDEDLTFPSCQHMDTKPRMNNNNLSDDLKGRM